MSDDQILPLPTAIADDWEVLPLRDIVDFVCDGDWIETKDQGGSDYRLLQVSNIGVGEFIETSKFRWITQSTFERIRCTEIMPGDVLVARMPEPTGRAWCVDPLPWKLVTAVDIAIIRPSAHVLDGRFLAYFLNSPVNLQRIDGLTTGTTRRRVRRADLERLEVPFPAFAEQRAIAGVLGALDDKIESNRRRLALLDELFLLECETASAGAVDDACAKRLGDIADVWLGGTPSRSEPAYWDGTIPWINSGSLHERPVLTPADWVTELGLARSATKLLPAGTTAVAITGATLGVVSRLGVECAINQSVVGIGVPRDRALNDYLYYWIRSNIGQITSSATGAAQQHVNKANFEDLKIPVPEDLGVRLHGAISALLDQQVLVAQESVALAALRDALLPELLSGRLRVREAEKVVEGAV